MTHRPLVGVDGCRAGWYAVIESSPSEHRWAVYPTFAALLAEMPPPAIIAVDIPIGLMDHGSRACDLIARQLLGPARASSVFPAPIRAVLEAQTHAQATARRREVEGKGMSIQSWAIVPKIREVDAALRAGPAQSARVFEVHPELTFRALHEGTAVAASKKTAEGRAARLVLLRHPFADVPARFIAARPKADVAMDDVVDAFAALWTARRIAAGTQGSVPSPVEHDAMGLPMAIVI